MPDQEDELLAASRKRMAELEQELEDSKDSLDTSRNWWASRFKRLEEWARADLPEPLKTEFFNIVANGFKDWLEQAPAYERILNQKNHEIERLKIQVDGTNALLAEQLKTTDALRAQLAALEIDKPYDCYWSRRAIAAEKRLADAMKLTTDATINHVQHCAR